MKSVRIKLREYFWYKWNPLVKYRPYKNAPVTGFYGCYTLFGFAIAYSNKPPEYSQIPYFAW